MTFFSVNIIKESNLHRLHRVLNLSLHKVSLRRRNNTFVSYSVMLSLVLDLIMENQSMLNLPTYLTLFRIAAIPLIIIVFYLPWHWAHPLSSLIFIMAAFTDWLDGYLARNLSQITQFGAFLDPVADKLIVAVALVLVVSAVPGPFLAIPAAIIVGREVAISALREWMAEIGKRTSVAVSLVGKAKTLIQMAALAFLLWFCPEAVNGWIFIIGSVMLYIAAVLTLWSMVMYLKAAWPDLTLH